MTTGKMVLAIALGCGFMVLGTLGALYLIERIFGSQSAWVRGLVIGAIAVLSLWAVNMLIKGSGTH